MKQAQILKVFLIALMCFGMTTIAPPGAKAETFTGGGGGHGCSHHDDDDDDNNSCDCGTHGDDGSGVYDDNPPVFNFPGQTYMLTFNNTSVCGNGKEVISSYTSNTTEATYALGAPDGSGAKIKSNGYLTVKLKDLLPAGTQYKIHWRQETGQSGTSTMKVKESKSLSSWSYNSVGTLSTTNESYFTTTLTAGIDLRYVKLWSQGSPYIKVDAITYCIPSLDTMVTVIIPNDTVNCNTTIPNPLVTDDCDTQVDLAYTDSVSAGSCAQGKIIKRKYTATDNCGNIAYAQRTIVVKDMTPPVISGITPNISYVTTIVPGTSCSNATSVSGSYTYDVCDANKALGVPDATGAKILGYGKLTVKLATTIPAGTQYKIHWRQETGQSGTSTLKIMESTTTSSWSTNSTISTTNENYFTTTLTATIATRYVKMWSQTSAKTRIDAVTYCVPDNDTIITVVIKNDTSECSTPAFANVTLSDNCDPNPTVTHQDITTGTCVTGKSIKRIWTARDACGNTSTASQTFVLLDQKAPIINGVGANQTIACPAIPQFSNPTTTDECNSAVTLTFNDVTTPGACANAYTKKRTWTAVDACGNSATASQTITVTDNVKPVLNGVGANATVSCPATPQFSQPTATDACGSATVTFNDVTTPGACAGSYSIKRTFTATDACGNTATASQTITVNDDSAPVLNGVGADATVSCPATPQFSQPTATDACGNATVTFQDVRTNGACANSYSIKRTFTATDACGNTATASQTITVTDNDAPVISGVGGTQTIECPAIPQFSSPSASDGCGSATLTFEDEVVAGDCAYEYSIIRTWTATDACGNTATASQTIITEDNLAPVLSGISADATIYCPAQPQFSNPSADDACDGATITHEDFRTNGACVNEYSVKRVWTAVDACGNSSTAAQTITVLDTAAPVIHGLAADKTIQCPEIPEFSSPSATDACGVANLDFLDDVTFGECPYEFSITRIWTATDACGNTSTASQAISAQDTSAPAIDGVGQDAIIRCPAQPEFSQPFIIDACDFNTGLTFEDDTLFDGAPETIMFVRTWSASDACGNVAETVSQLITRKNEYQPATGINPACHNSCDGKVSASGDCYSYMWSTGATTAAVENLCAGTYYVTMTDDFGYQVFDTVVLVAPSALSLDTIVTHVSCVGASDGSIDLSVTGGTAPYTYKWSNNFTSQDITGLVIGIYSVTVTDLHGCKDTIVAEIRQPEPFVIGAITTMVTCSGGSDGSIDLSVTGGTPPYTFLWSNGETTEDISGLVAGVYAVTVTDAHNCAATLTETVGEYFKVTATAVITHVACYGEMTGSIDLTVDGGLAPYHFAWSTGATTEDISGLTAGSYAVTITDSLGCFIHHTELVTEPELCNDNNLCTIDACVAGQCFYTPVICDDQNACTIDACVEGQCEFNAVICDDQNACTTDACVDGSCGYTAIICDDNDACTNDACVEGQCEYVAVICDDSDACTTDACVNGSCEYTAIICDDSDACTIDACINGSCEYTPVICDDQNGCTIDACVNGQCEFTAVICDDQNACTTDACVEGECVFTAIICDDADACTTDACVNGLCEYTPVNCNDNDACTIDACTEGTCSNTAIICDDQDECTNDACVEGECQYTRFMSITGFTLVDASNHEDITPIGDGAIISREQTCQFNIRAEVCGDSIVQSVKFLVDGQTFRIEEYVPYALAGDNPTGVYHPWVIAPGTYTITAIPHDAPNGLGNAGLPMTITVTVENGSAAACVCEDNDACTINIVNELGQCEFTPVFCDDNNACTTDACVNGECEFTAIICDDFDACTIDACVDGSCEFTAIICDDSDACTIDACVEGSCEYTAVFCDDQNACTTDACVDGSCEFTAIICDDEDACTIDACVDGSCEFVAVVCDDQNACTTDACVNGECEFTAIICDDLDACTNDACVDGSCEYTAIICDDNDACTTDACVNGSCEYTAIICDDNDACTTDACVNGSCEYTAIICDDNDACTTDACVNGSCEYTAIICDDSDACTTDACVDGSCEYTAIICDDNDACTTDACVDGSCEYTAIICDDSDACTIDNCVSGDCAYTAVICDDGNACTVDACINGQCEFTAVECADLDACTEDNCVDGVCVFTPVVCNDFDACTIDACVSGICEYTPVNCNDNDGCTIDACVNGSCQYTAVVCDDNEACTIDACIGGACQYNFVLCDDQNACTIDACVNGECEFVAVICDDQNACTTDECINGECSFTAVTCDDENACTIDACVDGSCEFTAVICDDQNLCTIDQCVNGECMYIPVICDDQNGCTTDACELGECIYTPVPPVVVETDVNICFGDSFYAGGVFRTEAGTYLDTYTGANGCDSLSIIHLSVTHIELTHESTDVSDTCIAGENQLCVLNFAGLPHGTILTGEEYAAYGIHFYAVAYPNTWTNTQNISQLVVFNTFATGTWDHDLQVDIGNVAIFPENLTDANNDGLVDMPNDTRWGGQQIFTFDFARTILSVTIADHDRAGGSITAYDEFNNIIISVPIPTLADGEVEVVGLNASGVRRLVVDDNDSGGLTDITFDCQNVCCDGTAEVFPSNGTAPYSFQWSNGETTAAVTGLCAGTHYVTVTDASGCTEIDTITINEPEQIGFRQMQTEFEEFTAYPVPFSGTFFFEYVAKEAGEAHFTMYNTVGQVVYNDNFYAVEGNNKEAVGFHGIDGMYIIELRKNNYSEFIKVNKSH